MLTLLKNKTLVFGLVTILTSLAFLRVAPVNTATALTSELQLSQKLAQQLSDSPRVLGQTTRVPIFPRGFSYPIPELGNCDSKNSCYQFCQQSENLELCSLVSFRNGFMSSNQLQKTLAFNSYLKSGYFAGCNSLSTCATLCDSDDAKNECTVLALNLDKGSRVLGATDENLSSSSDSILSRCSSIENCSSYGGTDVNSVLTTLIKNNQAPKNCITAEQCQDYCTIAQSNECTALFQNIAQLSGGMNGLPSRGRVLNMSDTPLPESGGAGGGGLIIGSGSDPNTVPGDGTGNPVTPPYQPTNYLGCVSNNQMISNPTGDFSTPQQTDNFTNNLSQCDQQFTPTASQTANFANTGRQKVSNSISTISDCVLSKSSSAEIQSCFAY